MKRIKFSLSAIIFLSIMVFTSCSSTQTGRVVEDFNDNWYFLLAGSESILKSDSANLAWRLLNLPHDWSIEGEFSDKNPAQAGGGALPGGVAWYKKVFKLPVTDTGKKIFIDFDGVYRNSEVYINGKLLGKRPNGYISFRYDLTPYLKFGNAENTILVKVDNSMQPNSRWYSGSGIYRNVWLVKTGLIYIDLWGTTVSTPVVNNKESIVHITTTIVNSRNKKALLSITNEIYNGEGKTVASKNIDSHIEAYGKYNFLQDIELNNPEFWSIENPYLYTVNTIVKVNGEITDNLSTNFGVRTFSFDENKGFSLNGKPVKINGVCNHHDLGCLGAAVNERAIERQLEILKEMGCNSIRTSHNPPAPELLDMCDKMGFIVMDETFDMWKKTKTQYDYSMYWDEWHAVDLHDHIMRDKNHPSVIIWSIGNEILEQWDTSGIKIAQELAKIVRDIDTTRLITSACNDPQPSNYIIQSGDLDLIGYNYKHLEFEKFPQTFPGQKFIATETVSALMTRGHYDMPSDSIRRWPIRWDLPFTSGNPDNTVSAYDNVSAPWGSTHEETWKIIKKYDFLSGQYIWTGFDYLGEPTPYGWPSRSSYFGIIDLAGFPKDVYYMYQSEWSDTPVLHIFPHWNWKAGEMVDVLAYTNCDEVELFLNGASLGKQTKGNDDLHLKWEVPFSEGTLKAIGWKNNEKLKEVEVHTAGEPSKINLTADRTEIDSDGKDLSFITVDIQDSKNILVPTANVLVNFEIEGKGEIVGVDNGNQVSHEPFKASYRKAYNGKCLVVVRSKKESGSIKLTATSEGIEPSTITITVN